jgi:hypothetical protein
MNIKKFVENVLSDKSNKLQKYSLGKLTSQQMKQVKEAIGIDLKNYIRVIDSFSIKHILKKHGNAEKEKKRGQIIVTPNDFQKIREILKKPDAISSKGKSKSGGTTLIEYRKRIVIEYIYIEEKRDRNKEIITKTMYKRK